MNKTAFYLLIEQLTQNFTEDKISEYTNNLNELKEKPVNLDENGKDPELDSFAIAFQTRNNNQRYKSKEFREYMQNYGYLSGARGQQINYAITALQWLGTIAEQLKGKHTEEGIKILRNHFKPLYKEAYSHRYETTEDKAKAIRKNPILYFFLQNGVIGGPEFDDLAIYNYINQLSGFVADYMKTKKNESLINRLQVCHGLMAAADLGLDSFRNFVPAFYADDDDALAREIQKKQENFETLLQMKCVEKANQTTPFHLNGAGMDPDLVEDNVLERFFNRKKGKRLVTPDMKVLLRYLKYLKDNYKLPEIKERFNTVAYETIQTQINKIRNNTDVKPKEFHDTEMFLQDVEAFSEKMICLRGAAEAPEKAPEQLITRIRNKADQLYERLNKLSYGNQSPEFAAMKKALEKLSSKTACDSKELLEQMIEAQNAADSYMKEKDRYRTEGKRATEKGQARYDTAKSISSMLEALNTQLAASLEKKNIRFVKNYSKYLHNHLDDKADPDFPDFCFSKEYYLHEAQNCLKKIQEKKEAFYALPDAGFSEIDFRKINSELKADFNAALSQYAFFMDLAVNKQKREQMTTQDLQKMRIKASRLELDVSQELWKYFIIIATQGIVDPVNKDDSINTNCDYEIMLDSFRVEDLYKTILEQKKALKDIENMSLQEVEDNIRNEKDRIADAEYLAESLDYPDKLITQKLTKIFYDERCAALSKRKELLFDTNRLELPGNQRVSQRGRS